MKNGRAVKRMLLYRSALIGLKEIGFTRVYSYNLGQESGVSAEQVRKDFSHYNITGNRKGGYDIDELLINLDRLFGKHITEHVVLVGMGNIGMALSHYRGFRGKNISIVATFDIDPSKQSKSHDVPVLSMEHLRDIVRKYGVSIGIIAVPASQAQHVCDQLISSGIKGILNFAPVVLKAPEEIKVNNINLSNELEGLVYLVHYE